MRAFIISSVIAASLVAGASTAAFAQGVYIGPGGVGVHVGPPAPRYVEPRRDEWRIDRREATRIARSNGMREVRDMDRRGGDWIVRGFGRRGSMTMIIDGRSGRARIR